MDANSLERVMKERINWLEVLIRENNSKISYDESDIECRKKDNISLQKQIDQIKKLIF